MSRPEVYTKTHETRGDLELSDWLRIYIHGMRRPAVFIVYRYPSL